MMLTVVLWWAALSSRCQTVLLPFTARLSQRVAAVSQTVLLHSVVQSNFKLSLLCRVGGC